MTLPFAPPAADPQSAHFHVGAEEYVVLSYPVPFTAPPAVLTPSEQFVFYGMLAGQSNVDIAARRGRSLRTVANQVASVFHKLGVGSRAELAAKHHDCADSRGR